MSDRAQFCSWSSWMHFNVLRHMRLACSAGDNEKFNRGLMLAKYLMARMSRNDE